MHYGPDGPDEDEIDQVTAAAEAPSTVVLQITGYDAGRIESMVAHQITAQVMKEAEAPDRIRRLVESAIDRVVNDQFELRIRSEVEAVLAEGWRQTDEYGTRRGEKVSLRDRVGALLGQRERDGYRRSWADETIKKAIDDLMSKSFVKEIEDMQKKFREQANELLTAKIADGLRSALGLSR